MSLLSRPVRRGAAALTLAFALAAGTAGCAKFDAALGKREAVVQFKPGTSNTVRLKVRAACSHVPRVKAEPLPATNLASAQLYDVRYLVSSATDAELANFQLCLQRFGSVAGITFYTPNGG